MPGAHEQLLLKCSPKENQREFGTDGIMAELLARGNRAKNYRNRGKKVIEIEQWL